jgi:hypothetical protein
MVSPAIAPDPPRRFPLPSAVERLGWAACWSVTTSLLLVAGWLCFRRLAGQMVQPLGFGALLAVGLTLAGIVSAVRMTEYRIGWRRAGHDWLARTHWVVPSAAMWLGAFALTLPGTATVAVAALWICVILNEVVWLWFWQHNRTARAMAPTGAVRSEPATVPVFARRPGHDIVDRPTEPIDDGELQLPNEVSQQITRTQTGSQGDTLAGLLRAVFQPGERSRYLHVAICPPMAGRPNVDVVQLSGPSTRVKAAEIQSFGVRFDLRLLSTSTREESVLIHFEASCPD